MSSGLEKLSMIGAGVLGGQIAWQSAFSGKQVVVYDINEEGLERCRAAQQMYAGIYQQDLGATPEQIEKTRARLRFTTDLADAVADADVVIEAVPEIPEVKIELYRKMASLLPARTIIATNSSTLLPSQFAEYTGRPEKYCALHFANLIWALNMAEVMAHSGTSEATLTAITGYAIEIGMVPIPVQKEQNGYVLNSWFAPLLQAGLSLVVNGVSTPEYVDRTFMIANRCSVGPCGMIDVVGMATAYNIGMHWGTVNKDAQQLKNAAYIKQHFIDKGLMGLATGEGFYKYPNPAYQAPGFLDVPDMSVVAGLVQLIKPS
jgi:3-hydroxybutyryl-CoA dehydrogenase